jgi:lipopolysaccharide/colanic/teichoic acid biosynthesis glycosyltransferase
MGATLNERLQARAPEFILPENFGIPVARPVKRVVDFSGAILGLLLLMPVMLILGVLIKLDSPGPILFRQLRMGRGGRFFWILKFRSMVPDVEDGLVELEPRDESASGGLSPIRCDARVTRLGRYLRRTSLDELPQLINVLRGEMSLVGPRPLHMRDCERLARLDPGSFEHRKLVPPGMTGLAQVSGRRELSPNEILKLDRLYVESWTIRRDLAILILTFGIVLSGKGAL